MSGDGSGRDDDGRWRFTRRAAVLGLGQLALFGGLGTRLYQMQVIDGARYRPLSDQNRIDVQTIAAVRGRILDRAGFVLADNRESFAVSLVPGLAGDVRSVLERLARIVQLAPGARERILARARRQSRNLPILVAGDLSFAQVAEINVLAPQLPGVRAETVWLRRYADGETMGHLVGYVGSVDRQALEDPDPALRLPQMRVGKAGAELAAEHELRGVRGSNRIEVDAKGRMVRSLEQSDPVAGHDVTLTVDRHVQGRVLARLARERRGAVVALDVTTGEVVALASVPAFDPAELTGRLSHQSWHRLVAIANKPMLNRATAGLYPPGSTFKLVTALAALHAGVVSPKDYVHCDGSYELGGHSFRCWKRGGHGRVDLNRAITESCDVFFYETAQKTGIDSISDMARYLGLGQQLGSDFPLQKAGVIPDQDWKRGNLGRSWMGGETLLAAIGQGFVTATPLQLATMTARIATGRAVVPSLIRSGSAAGSPREFEPLRLEPRWLDAVRRGMISVVNGDGGTGSNASLDRGDILVAGKTGTSQVNRASTDRNQAELEWEHRDHALFVAYAPASAPRYAVAVVVEHGGGGGATAAPVARDVLEILFEHDGRLPARPAPEAKTASPEVQPPQPSAASPAAAGEPATRAPDTVPPGGPASPIGDEAARRVRGAAAAAVAPEG